MWGGERRAEAGLLGRAFRVALVVLPLGALANVVYAAMATDPAALASLDRFPHRYLLLALGLALVPWATNSLRLLIWTRLLGYRLRFRHTLHATLAAELGAAVSPTAVGGDLVKWGVLVRRGVTPGEAASLVTLPSIEDALFFSLALPAALLASSAWEPALLWRVGSRIQERAGVAALLLAGALVVGWGVLRLVLGGAFGRCARRLMLRLVARLRRRLRRIWRDACAAFRLVARRGKARFALTMALTAIQWTARYSVILALLAFLGAPIDPLLFWVLQWVVFTLMSFMPTPGAAGGAEAAFSLIYGALLPAGMLGIATAGWRFLTFYVQVGLAAVVFLALRRYRFGRVRRVGTASSGSSGQ